MTSYPNSGRGMGQEAIDKLREVHKKPIQVATRCSANYFGSTLVGTVAGTTYEYAHVMKTDCHSLQLVFANFYPTQSSESSNANAITVGVTIRHNGGISRIHFNGEATHTIAQGGIAITDPILRDIPVGDTFYTRTWVSVADAAHTYPQGIALDSSLGDGVFAGDGTQTGTFTSSTVNGFGPAAIVGIPVQDDAVAFALFGDSIVAGADGTGWCTDVVSDKYGYSILSKSGASADGLYVTSANSYRLRLAKYFTHAIVNFGTNDFNGSVPVGSQIEKFKTIWKLLQGVGLEVYHSTTMPRSTGVYTTVEGQTAYNGNSYNDKRVAFNENLRNGDYDVRVLDVSRFVENIADTGIWVPNYTGDGIHPNEAAMSAIVAGLDLNID